MAEVKLSVSNPTSRWSMAARSSLWRYSTGSSIVMMWHERRWLMWSTIAASVVVLPDPVGPVTSTSPRWCSLKRRTTSGSPSSPKVEALVRTRRMARATDQRWRKALVRKRPRPCTL